MGYQREEKREVNLACGFLATKRQEMADGERKKATAMVAVEVGDGAPASLRGKQREPEVEHRLANPTVETTSPKSP